VRNLQGLLNFHLARTSAAPLKPDGQFGPLTDRAVRRFQTLNRLQVDGFVGPQTTAALIDMRSAISFTQMTPTGADSASIAGLVTTGSARLGPRFASFIRPGPVSAAPRLQSQFLRTQSFGNTVGQSAPPTAPLPVQQTVVVGVGQQANFNPWFISPLVLTVQWNILLQNDGRRLFQISPGVQFFQNQVGSPSGNWSGQGFIQMGPVGPLGPDGKPQPLLKLGPLDLFNPFVQAFVQKNQGQPAGAGFAFGDQVNWVLIPDVLSVNANVQEVFSTDLSTGRAAVPATQVLGGVTVDVIQIARKIF
jgi:peptidoglycan hydrolase-like protein with peptidoglycan-binding domain